MNNAVKRFVQFIVIASWVDGWATLIEVEKGITTELNPVMAGLIGNALLFVLIKFTVTTSAVFFLFNLGRRYTLAFLSIVYFVILIMHLYILLILAGSY